MKVLDIVANNLATYFESDNPRFDRDRFLSACGIKSELCPTCEHHILDPRDKKAYEAEMCPQCYEEHMVYE